MSAGTTSFAAARRRATAIGIDPLSPIVAFPALWLFGVAVAQLQVLRFQGGWSATAWLVMLAVPVAFVCGGVIGERIAVRVAPASAELPREPKTSRLLRGVLVALLAIGFAEIVHQSVVSGSVPLLSGNIDRSRIGQAGGPTLLLLEALSVAIVIALTVPTRLLARNHRFELGVAAVALGLLLLQGGRGLVVLPIAVAFLARWFYWGRPKAGAVAAVAAALTLAVAGLFFARIAQNPEQPLQAEIYNEVIDGTPAPLVPLLPYYLALTTNFDSLANLVDYFPSQQPFGGGKYDAGAIDRFVEGEGDIAETSELLNPPWVTSTAAGPLWGDGGLPWVVVGMALIGALCAGGYRYARTTGTFRHALVAAYLLYLALFGVYVNYWTSFTNWLLVIPALAIVGAIAESPTRPAGLLQRARDLLGWARGRAAAALRPLEPVLSPLRRLMPSSEQLSNASKRLRGPVAIAAGVIALLVVAGLLIKEDSPDGGLPIDPAITVQKADRPARDVRLATDGDIPDDNAPVWVFGARGGRTDVSLVRVSGERAGRRQEVRAAVAPPSRGEVLDVARWDPNLETESLFRILPTATGADVTVERLDEGGGRLVSGSATLPQLPAGATREFAVATYSGSRPDLYVIDRGLDSERARVQVLSGESAFARSLVDNRLPVAGLDPGRWVVDVGKALAPTDVTQAERPDIVMVLRDGSQGGQPELHVIGGESGYNSFALQRTFALSEQIEGDSRFLFGAIVGGSAIYAIDPLRGEPRTIRPITFQPSGQVV